MYFSYFDFIPDGTHTKESQNANPHHYEKHTRAQCLHPVFLSLALQYPAKARFLKLLSSPSPSVWVCDSLVMILEPIPTCGVPPTPKSNSPTPVGCPAIQLNSDTTSLEIALDHKFRAQCHKTTPCPQLSQTQDVTCASDPLATDWRFPVPPL